MNRLLMSMLALVLILVAAGCRGDTERDAKEHVDTGYADVVLELRPDPPVALKDTEFIAEVRDSEGAPIEGAEVVFDLSMPGMYHGENRPVAAEEMPGRYSATGILTMGGKWLISVEVKAEGVDVVKKFYADAVNG